MKFKVQILILGFERLKKCLLGEEIGGRNCPFCTADNSPASSDVLGFTTDSESVNPIDDICFLWHLRKPPRNITFS